MNLIDFLTGKLEFSIVTENGTFTTIISKKKLIANLNNELLQFAGNDREIKANRKSLIDLIEKLQQIP